MYFFTQKQIHFYIEIETKIISRILLQIGKGSFNFKYLDDYKKNIIFIKIIVIYIKKL